MVLHREDEGELIAPPSGRLRMGSIVQPRARASSRAARQRNQTGAGEAAADQLLTEAV